MVVDCGHSGDDDLFRLPPKRDRCPICYEQLPHYTKIAWQTCCGKSLCGDCLIDSNEATGGDICPFCRADFVEGEEQIKRIEKLVIRDDGNAFYAIGFDTYYGRNGLSKDKLRAIQYMEEGAKLGSHAALDFLSRAYMFGQGGVEKDETRAKQYLKVAAKTGDHQARFYLGNIELDQDNYHLAMKHFFVAAKNGHAESLSKIEQEFVNGLVTKTDLAEAEIQMNECGLKAAANALQN